MLYLALVLPLACAFSYNFLASKQYLFVELFSDRFTELRIAIYEGASKQSEVLASNDQYLMTHYRLKPGIYYSLDLRLSSDNYTIREVEDK